MECVLLAIFSKKNLMDFLSNMIVNTVSLSNLKFVYVICVYTYAHHLGDVR